MRVAWLKIERFRCIKDATLFPETENVYLGPNNVGKTTVLEALNLLLSPDIGNRDLVDENDFYLRRYRHEDNSSGTAATANTTAGSDPQTMEDDSHSIRIQAVLTDLDDDDRAEFSSVLVPWDSTARLVIESTEEGVDPFAQATRAIRVCFEAWYDEAEDAFAWKSYFRTDPALDRDTCVPFNTKHKRRIGFLIYRDFRALHRPITIENYWLFGRLLQSQDAMPKRFESVLAALKGAVGSLFDEPEFARTVAEYRDELMRYLPLSIGGDGGLSFEATDRTRADVKAIAQMYVADEIPLPLQKMGAGTRSLAILAILLLIARKRGRGIIALEEPETFLFPHAQRRVMDEVRQLSTQAFVTTHSLYILERMPVSSFQRLVRNNTGDVTATHLVSTNKEAKILRDRLRRQLSEAILGRGAIVVEEDSTRLWILRASALLNGKVVDGQHLEALELQGIAVVTGVGNTDIPELCMVLKRAGLQVVAFLDRVKPDDLNLYLTKSPETPFYFQRDAGLEDLLVRELPATVLRDLLVECPLTKHRYSDADVTSWPLEVFNDKARECLRQHKGHQTVHEWLCDRVDLSAMPASFKRLVWAVEQSMSGAGPGTCSLLPGP